MGSGKMKLASEISPEKRAVIVKRIMMKAKPIQEGVVPKESAAPPTSSHHDGLIREKGKINPPRIDKEAVFGWMMSGLGKMLGKTKPSMAAVGAIRPPQPPGARAAMFGKSPTPGVHSGGDVSRVMGKGPSTGGWEHLGADEARALLKAALGGAA